jgi:membrane-associated phospholipid phosphatase
MTNEEKWEKRNWFLFLIGYFAIGYVIINWINEGRSNYYDVALPFESRIPFISFFILGYLFVYISVFYLYLIVDDIKLWRRGVVAYIVLTSLCYIVYLAFPVQMVDRPDVSDMIVRNWIDKVVRAYFVLDRPFNALPSIHAAYPTMAVLVVWRTAKVGRWVLLAMTLLISVSVVVVKQHYVMDVVAGIAAAIIAYLLVIKTKRWWYPKLWSG